MIVVDASVLGPALLDDKVIGHQLRERLQGERVVAPALIDLEVLSIWRGLARSRRVPARRLERSRAHLASAPLIRAAHIHLLPRVWELRHNLSPYDASYVALAEYLDTVLLTGDVRLARAPGIRCDVELATVER